MEDSYDDRDRQRGSLLARSYCSWVTSLPSAPSASAGQRFCGGATTATSPQTVVQLAPLLKPRTSKTSVGGAIRRTAATSGAVSRGPPVKVSIASSRACPKAMTGV